jgi:uncharacterized NAD-dependent epimerase/dehydratase family protein
MISTAPFQLAGRRTLLLADGSFSQVEAKTAVCYLMYRSEDVVAVLDRDRAGETTGAVVGLGGDTPVVASVAEALAVRPEVAIVGTAPMGGALDGPLREQVVACLDAGVDVVSGLHSFLSDDEALAALAAARGARIWDVRRVEDQKRVSTGGGCSTGASVVLVTGTDCNVGKMTAAVALDRGAQERGIRSAWAATGQTGIMLRGRGVAVDRVIADFIGGATEALVDVEAEGADLVWVEGQGAIVHPGYAGVTLGIMYGAMPDALVLAHTADREHFKRLGSLPLPPIPQLIRLHEELMRPFKPARVAAIAVNTSCLDERAARAYLEELSSETGRVADDVIRFGSAAVIDAVVDALEVRR